MINQINNILSKSKTIAIVGHTNPDGDCFGSISGMHDYIVEKFNCVVHCFADCNAVAEEFEPFVKDLPFNLEPLSQYDTCICLDSSDEGRFGKYIDVFKNSTHTICIDHHATNVGFAEINLINTISSNCENVYNFLKQSNFDIPKSTAGKIFAGIITDTNNLTNKAVTSNTYLVVADLISKGINDYKIRRYFFGENSMPQFKLLATAMSSAKFYNNNTIMIMKITKQDLQNCGATQEDLVPIVNQAFCMKHAMCAMLISPRNDETHISFRAHDGIDVSVVAQHFGGGGHKLAAACTVPSFSDEDLQYSIDKLIAQVNSLTEKDEDLF